MVTQLFQTAITAQIYGLNDRCLKFTRLVSSGGSRFILVPLNVCACVCPCCWKCEDILADPQTLKVC